ncbi:zinc finger protein 718-like [Bradysia coprophila]|uniref:zinc finger protein 718-like n=1 Tax=Bradysia coprophila TaxID=38358 RepID=UPI00187D9860|nr:zinc finger protein 718-like [Bradysia coprophila]
MGYNDFLELITRNTSNKLDDYKELCRICLENQPNSVDISENSCSSVKRSEAIRSNYITISKQYLPTSDEYPKFVCPSCEIYLGQLARFAQQIEENAENWEIFLSRRRMEECADIVDGIKIEIGEEKCDNGPVNDTYIADALEMAELPPMKIEEIFAAPLPAIDSIDKPRKKYKRKPKLSFVTTVFERTCQHCDEPTFSSLTRLYSHQKLMHPDIRAYSCDLCGNKFRAKDAVVRHMKERHADNGRKHQCQFCAKLFYTDREVKGHEKCHLNERSYVCDFCGKGFNNKSELNAHLKSKAHNANYAMIKHKKYARNKANNKTVYRCTLCVPATIWSDLEERTKHRDMAHKIFDCGVCKNSFLTIESLNSHKLLHSNKPRPHVCKVCNATFSQASHLTSHMKCRHSDRKAFPCSFCGKTFPENFNLTSHVNLVHKKGERVKCNECEANFSSTKYLRRHMLERHSTTPSRYDCKDCGTKNSSGRMLALHRLKFHTNDNQ